MKKNLFIVGALFILFPLASLGQAAENGSIKSKQNKRYDGQPLANLTRGPYLQVATSNSIVVRWRTDTWARSRVRYGTAPGQPEFYRR